MTYADKQEEAGILRGSIETFSGDRIAPLDPDPSKIHIQDIAHSLGNMCRYNGHCRFFYSVAEHSVLMSREASDENKLAALLHDASEAYVSDVCHPIKSELGNFNEIEHRIQEIIADKYGFPYPFPEEVHDLDGAIFATELQQVMRRGDHLTREEPLDVQIEGWLPFRASTEFLKTWSDLTGVSVTVSVGGL